VKVQAVKIENVFEVPVKEVVQLLGGAQDILARLTPSDDSTGGKPAGWEVLTTMELLFQVSTFIKLKCCRLERPH
jgi:hypothetical protein